MIEELRSANPHQTVWDRGDKSSVRGLHVRVTGSNHKMFYLYYRTRDGKERRPKIGELGPITLGEARKRAKALLDRIALGEDPKALWDEKREEMTVEELFNLCWDSHWGNEKFSVSNTGSGWSSHIRHHWEKNMKPSLGNLKLSDLTPSRVREWHRGMEAIPVSGNKALCALSKMFTFAEERELRPQHSNPCRLVKKFPERSRKRFATEEEIQKIARLLEKEIGSNPAGVAFLYILMFSGSRPRAVERARWEDLKEFEIDGKQYGLLEFSGKSTAKTGDEERVILPPQAMEAINRLPRIKGFTITGIKMPRRLWRRVKEEAGCPDLWARDWRRTFATIGMTGGVDIGTIGELLNHRSTETTKIYAKVMETRKVEAAAKIAGLLSDLMKEKVG